MRLMRLLGLCAFFLCSCQLRVFEPSLVKTRSLRLTTQGHRTQSTTFDGTAIQAVAIDFIGADQTTILRSVTDVNEVARTTDDVRVTAEVPLGDLYARATLFSFGSSSEVTEIWTYGDITTMINPALVGTITVDTAGPVNLQLVAAPAAVAPAQGNFVFCYDSSVTTPTLVVGGDSGSCADIFPDFPNAMLFSGVDETAGLSVLTANYPRASSTTAGSTLMSAVYTFSKPYLAGFPMTFSLQVNSSQTAVPAGSFTLTLQKDSDATTTVTNGSANFVVPGSYTVSEDDPTSLHYEKTSTVCTDFASSDWATTSPRAAVMVPARPMVSPSRPIWTSPANPGFELQKGSSRSFG